MITGLVRKIIHFTWRPAILHYLRKDRVWHYKDITLHVKKGVFHPAFFFSSIQLVDFLAGLNSTNKSLLDIGCGAGLLPVFAAKLGYRVTAVDISERAVENTILNASLNNVEVNALLSDMFSSLPFQQFDIVMVNPPYYKKKPVNEAEHAWYCGENMEYFTRLFSGLDAYIAGNTILYMILSSDCDISSIMHLAGRHQFTMTEVYSKRKLWEWNYIYEIKKIESA